MLAENELKALVILLEDNDENVWQIAFNALSQTDVQQIPMLNDYLFEAVNTSEQRDRLEEAIDHIKVNHLSKQLVEWKNNGGKNLLSAMVTICQFKYPDLTEAYLIQKLEGLRLDAWLEFHYDLTSFEKVKILNYILFQLHGFKGNEANYLHPDNSFINRVLDTKAGNPISLSIIYMLLAQRLNVPVYGVNLPRHFIMAYVENEETETLQNFGEKQEISDLPIGDVKFYINAYNGGGVFNFDHLKKIMGDMDLEVKPEYYEPCTNTDIVRRVLMNLFNSYAHMNMKESKLIDKVLAAYNADGL
jgi:regulator of sirC expression with transglutaminase-like and TPR domain